MKLRGYRLRVDWGGVKLLLRRLAIILFVLTIPYATGRLVSIYTGQRPQMAEEVPLSYAHFLEGAVLLVVLMFIILVLAFIVGVVFDHVLDIEEVTDDGA